MNNYQDAVSKVYEQLDSCIIVGLTGRTGSGCTTTSKILETKKFTDLDLATPKKKDFKDVEERKNAIIYKYMKSEWQRFVTIEVSSIIMSFIFERTYDQFEEFLNSLCKSKDSNFHIGGYDELKRKMSGLKTLFNNEVDIENDKEENLEYIYDYYTNTINKHKKMFSDIFCEYSCYDSPKSNFTKQKENKSKLYTYLLQTFGNNIRSSGNPYDNNFSKSNFNEVAERVSKIIEIIKKYNDKNKCKKTRICIDAIRNPYEAYYFRDLYKSFYLVSVSTDDDERIRRLSGFDEQELASLDSMEYPGELEGGKIFYQQSIQECLQISDIHLYNPHSEDSTYEQLTTNLVRYIALMQHPGLVTPTNIERCMQIAFNAKFNSGCLSRQVGAVITDDNYYIKAIGWNEVPQGQISCGLRSVFNYFSERDRETFSKFELENSEFKESLRKIKDSFECEDCKKISKKYNISYCFKDVYNAIKNDKNQVYTRSLHAEENAFLQMSKFGGEGIMGGKLFVTASPCELCSKKSYQLGIRDIYFIDPYPGIATSHILKLGEKETNPNLHIFFGAIGNAYVALYSQRFAVKDELKLLSGIKMKEKLRNKKADNKKIYDELRYSNMCLELIMDTRTDVEFLQNASVIRKGKPLERISKKISWTGSTYGKTIVNDPNAEYTLEEESCKDGICKFFIIPNKPYDADTEFSYSVKTIAKDDQKIMNPLLSHHVKAKIDKLQLIVKFNINNFEQQPKDFKFNLYANIDENILFSSEDVDLKEEEGYYVVEKSVDNPYLLYTYAIEWKF